MFKLTKIYPRDIIALVVLVFSLILISKGINSIVSGIVIMIVSFYFMRRIDGEGEPERDLTERVKKLEIEKTITAKFADVPKKTYTPSKLPEGQLTSGDFKPTPSPRT